MNNIWNRHIKTIRSAILRLLFSCLFLNALNLFAYTELLFSRDECSVGSASPNEHIQDAGWQDERVVYSGLRPVEERSADTGLLLRRYIYEPGYNVPCMVLEDRNGDGKVDSGSDARHILLYDDRGTVLGVVDGHADGSGQIIEKLYYNASGIPTSMRPTESGDVPMTDEYGLELNRSRYVRFGFTGMYLEPLTAKKESGS